MDIVNNREMLDVYNEKGEKVDKINRSDYKLEGLSKGKYCCVVQSMVKHIDGNYLLMRRSKDKDLNPGEWEFTPGGFVLADEIPRVAAEREIVEETGLKPKSLILTQCFCDENETLIKYRYLALVDSKDVKYQVGETIDHKWYCTSCLLDFLQCGNGIKDQKNRNCNLKMIEKLNSINSFTNAIKRLFGKQLRAIYLYDKVGIEHSKLDALILIICQNYNNKLIDLCARYENQFSSKDNKLAIFWVEEDTVLNDGTNIELNSCYQFGYDAPLKENIDIFSQPIGDANFKSCKEKSGYINCPFPLEIFSSAEWQGF